MRVLSWTLALAVVSTGCGRKAEQSRAPAMSDSGGSMGSMQMSMQGMQMMPQMRAHLDSLAAMPPSQMALALAAHQDLASKMMDAMGADMRGMNMKPDSAWAALGDSIRVDLADLPSLSGEGLKNRVQAHVGRMKRMLAMHEGMMRM